jgi:Uncharacterized protein conserved in bacteria (DUF2252)
VTVVQAGSEYPTVAESVSLGTSARRLAPRSSHATFEPSPDRPDPVQLLERQTRTRVPELVPIRYGRTLVSPFAFFRGAAAIMANDLASTPQSGFRVQCCGDAVSAYRTTMIDLAGMDSLAVWYSRFEIESLLSQYGSQFAPKMFKQTEKALTRARTKDSISALSKLTHVVDGQTRIVD